MWNRLLLVLLLAVGTAEAQVTRHIKAGCTFNGDGTTSDCASVAAGVGAYSSCANWESAEELHDFATNGMHNAIFHACDDAVDSNCVEGYDTAICTVIGWSGQSASAYIHMDGASDLNGIDGIEIDKYTFDADADSLTIREPYTVVSRLQLMADSSGSDTVLSAGSGCIDCRFTRNYIENSGAGGTGDSAVSSNASGNNVQIDNNYITTNGVTTGLERGIYQAHATSIVPILVYNNTIVGFDNCIITNGGDITARNNILYNCGTAASGDFTGETGYNATDNADINYTCDLAGPPCTGDVESASFTFVNAVGGDHHLSTSDTAAKDSGSQPTGWNYSYTIDFDGDTYGTWDIGMDEPTVEVNYYVDTDSGLDAAGEDGSALEPWASISYAISRTSSSTGDNVVINCTGSAADTVGRIDFNGYVADSLTIVGDTATTYSYDTSRYRLELTDVLTATIYNRNNAVPITIRNFQIQLTNSTGNARIYFDTGLTTGADITLENNYFHIINNNTTVKTLGGVQFGSSVPTGLIVNSVVRLTGTEGTGVRGIEGGSGDCFNTVVHGTWDLGIYRNGIMRNCAVIGATDSLSVVGSTVSNMFTDDGAGDTGTTNVSNWAAEFVDHVNGNYGLKSGSPNLRDGGTDVSSENGGIDTDYTGVSRGATWDAGIAEYVSSGQTAIISILDSMGEL